MNFSKKERKNYRKVFQKPVYYNFDECNWEWGDLIQGKDISELYSEIDSITHVIKMSERTGDITAYWHTMEYHPGKIVRDCGHLSYDNNEGVFAFVILFLFLRIWISNMCLNGRPYRIGSI